MLSHEDTSENSQLLADENTVGLFTRDKIKTVIHPADLQKTLIRTSHQVYVVSKKRLRKRL